MPADTIARAVKKGSGDGDDGSQMAEVRYEGYGPGGTAILLEAFTDNRNRTASAVRSTFSKGGGTLAAAGAVAWQFDQRGILIAEADPESAEELAMAAIDAGAEDFDADGSILQIYSYPCWGAIGANWGGASIYPTSIKKTQVLNRWSI